GVLVSKSYGHRNLVDCIDILWGRHLLRLQTFRKCRRGLSLSQAVDTVVVKHVCEVEIPSSRVDEMSRPNSRPVTVSTDSNDRQAGIRQLGSRRDRQDSAVQSVETVRVDKVGSLTRTSDTREQSYAMRLKLHLQESHLDRVYDAKVPATRAPVIVNLGPIVFQLKHGSV